MQRILEQIHRQVVAEGRPEWQRAGPIFLTVAARLSLSLMTQPGVAVFWPAAGVASGTVIAFGRAAWWPVGIGVIAANIPANLTTDRNVLSSSIFSLSDAGEALLVAWLIERSIGSNFSLGRLHHVLGLLAAAIVGAAVSGVGGTLGYKLGYNPDDPAWTVWWQWVVSDTIGIIAVAPLIIGLVAAFGAPPSRRELVEGVVALIAVAATAGLTIFMLPSDWWETCVAVVLLFPVVLWVVARCQPVFASAAVFIVSLIFMTTVAFKLGNFGTTAPSMEYSIVSAQITILGTALCALIARVAAVVMYTREGSGSNADFAQALDRRIQSMADAHLLLSESRWQGVDLLNLVEHQVAPYTNKANITIEGPQVALTAVATQAVAMVLHELVTNAVKYGALSRPVGQVAVSWMLGVNGGAPKRVMVEWREAGGPPVVAPARSSYGTSLIRDLIPHELGGTAQLAFPIEGVCCRIEFPL